MNIIATFLNKTFLNKLIEVINSLFKLILIICIVVYLIIYYQSTLNKRFQYYNPTENQKDLVIFDTKKGEMYIFLPGKDKEPAKWWIKASPFSKREFIPFE